MKAALWRPSGCGSSVRPPPQNSFEIFNAPDALAQLLYLHGHLGNDMLHAAALLVELGFLPDYERLSASGQEGVAPLTESPLIDTLKTVGMPHQPERHRATQ